MLVRLLGGVEVASPDDQWRTVPGKRAGVLAVLAVAAGEPVAADELVHRVWGGAAVALADGAVYPHITRLRATLAPAGLTISRARGGYVLDIDADQVDLLTVRELAVRAREAAEAGENATALAAWRRATALLRGEALAGVDGDWAERFRQSFGGEARSLLAERYGWELRWGRHLAVVDELLAAVVRYPTCEALAEHLMLALYRSGRQAEALEAFARIVSLLRDRLGVDPGEPLRRLHKRILNQDADLVAPAEVELSDEPVVGNGKPDGFAPSPVPAQLPAPTRTFLGREDESAALRRGADRSSLLVVDGMPGVGKTAIAVHVATSLADRYPDGQLFVDLHGFSGDVAAVTPADALARMLRGLGVEDDQLPTDVDERSAMLRTRLVGRRVLILLDNAADGAQVRPMLPGGSDCLTIITSRRRMPDLLEAEPITLDVMKPDDAIRLLAAAVDDPRRVTAAGTDAVSANGFADATASVSSAGSSDTTAPASSTGSADATASDAAELVEAAGRLPLAIRLIAARLRNRRHWTTGYLLERLRERPVLDELSTQDVAVASAFTVSYTELDVEQRRLFRLLGLFPGQDFDATIAGAVAGVAPEAADRMLEELVDAHLLRSAEPGRYRFHDLMRHYAATIAAETETAADLGAARRRLYDTAVVMLRHATARYSTHRTFYPKLIDPGVVCEPGWRTEAEAADWTRTELGNLLAMTRDALAHRMDRHGAEMAAALCSHLNHFGLDRDTEPVTRWGLESARRLADEQCEGYFLNKHAGALLARGDIEQAERQHRRALDIRRRLGDARHIVGSLANLSLVYVATGDWDRAIDLRGEALDVAVSSGNTDLELIVRMMLAYALCEISRTAEARSQLERAEELLADSGGGEIGRMQLATHWGNLRRAEGHPAEARSLHERTLAYYRSRGDVVGTAIVEAEVTHDLIDQGRWEEARSVGNKALAALIDHEDVIQRAEILLLLARVCLERREYDEAVEQLRAAADIARDRKAAHLVAAADWGLSQVASAKGDKENAIRYAERALTYFSRFELPQAEAIRDFLSES